MTITGLDGKELTLAIVKRKIASLDATYRTQRNALWTLLRAVECEAAGVPLVNLEASLDATDDGTMDVPPPLRADDPANEPDIPPGVDDGLAGPGKTDARFVPTKKWAGARPAKSKPDGDPEDFEDRTPDAGA